MALYDMKCKKCGNVFEIRQSMSAPCPKCPAEQDGKICGGETFKKIGLSSFHLKGTGWYKTDYK